MNEPPGLTLHLPATPLHPALYLEGLSANENQELCDIRRLERQFTKDKAELFDDYHEDLFDWVEQALSIARQRIICFLARVLEAIQSF